MATFYRKLKKKAHTQEKCKRRHNGAKAFFYKTLLFSIVLLYSPMQCSGNKNDSVCQSNKKELKQKKNVCWKAQLWIFNANPTNYNNCSNVTHWRKIDDTFQLQVLIFYTFTENDLVSICDNAKVNLLNSYAHAQSIVDISLKSFCATATRCSHFTSFHFCRISKRFYPRKRNRK